MIKKILDDHKKHLLLIFLTAGLYFTRIFSKIILFKPDGFYAGHQNVWSDWALHVTLTNTFANKPFDEWLLYHPYFSEGRLTYPFLTNAISGILMKLGLSITQAMIWPSIFLILLLLVGLYFLFFQILKSRKKAVLGIFIFLTSAGPGFIKFLKEFFANPNTNLLSYPPIDYTRTLQYQWLAGNIPAAMLIPQRAFLIGITVGVWSLLLLIIATQQKDFLQKNPRKNKLSRRTKKILITAGLLAGIMPIAHMHSFIAVVIISGSICLSIFYNFFKSEHSGELPARVFKKIIKKLRHIKNLLYFILPAAIISTTLYFTFIHGGIQKSDFMRTSFGWTSEKDLISWILMWWKLWGVMLPLALYSFKKIINSSNKKTREVGPYFYGFFSLFALANIIIFQPTAWDNTKLFAWIYLGFSLLAAHTIIELWKNKAKKITYKIAAIFLLIMLSSTGILELIRLQRFDKNTFILNRIEDINFAQYIMENTKTDSIFLTASNHNHPLLMWGSRPIVLGYKGWVTNFGFDIDERSEDVKNIFENPEQSKHLLKKYNVDYVVIGELEKKEFTVNQKYFDENFSLKFQDLNTNVYNINLPRPPKP